MLWGQIIILLVRLNHKSYVLPPYKQLHHRVLLCGEGNFHPVFIKAQGAGVVGEGSGGDEAVRPRQAVAATADKGLYLRPQSDGLKGLVT